jgi:hypothetical protein
MKGYDMSNSDVTAIVERAVRLSLGSEFFRTFLTWAEKWLDGSDRTRASAFRAKCLANQWREFAGYSHLVHALALTADAAVQLDWAEAQPWRANLARESAEWAIKAFGCADKPTPGPDRTDGPELVLDDWNYGPGGVRRGRSYGPGEV